MPNAVEGLNISSGTAPDLLKVLAILPGTIVRRFAVS